METNLRENPPAGYALLSSRRCEITDLIWPSQKSSSEWIPLFPKEGPFRRLVGRWHDESTIGAFLWARFFLALASQLVNSRLEISDGNSHYGLIPSSGFPMSIQPSHEMDVVPAHCEFKATDQEREVGMKSGFHEWRLDRGRGFRDFCLLCVKVSGRFQEGIDHCGEFP